MSLLHQPRKGGVGGLGGGIGGGLGGVGVGGGGGGVVASPPPFHRVDILGPLPKVSVYY